MPPTELEMAPEFHLTEELRHLQTRMTSLFLHQKSRGGIIDAGAEENNVISLAPEEQLSEEQKNSEDAVDSTSRSDIPAEPHFVTPVVSAAFIIFPKICLRYETLSSATAKCTNTTPASQSLKPSPRRKQSEPQPSFASRQHSTLHQRIDEQQLLTPQPASLQSWATAPQPWSPPSLSATITAASTSQRPDFVQPEHEMTMAFGCQQRYRNENADFLLMIYRVAVAIVVGKFTLVRSK